MWLSYFPDRPLRDLENCPHRRKGFSRRSEDTESPFRSTEKGRYRRRGEETTRPGLSRPIPAPCRAAAGPVCSPGHNGPPSLSSARSFPTYTLAASSSRIAATLRRCPFSGIARCRNDSVANVVSSGGCEVSLDSPMARIDVETLAAEKTHQRHTETLRYLHRQTGWCTYCS